MHLALKAQVPDRLGHPRVQRLLVVVKGHDSPRGHGSAPRLEQERRFPLARVSCPRIRGRRRCREAGLPRPSPPSARSFAARRSPQVPGRAPDSVAPPGHMTPPSAESHSGQARSPSRPHPYRARPLFCAPVPLRVGRPAHAGESPKRGRSRRRRGARPTTLARRRAPPWAAAHASSPPAAEAFRLAGAGRPYRWHGAPAGPYPRSPDSSTRLTAVR